MLFVHLFLHTKEYNCSTQVGVESSLRSNGRQAFLTLHNNPIKYLKSCLVLRRWSNIFQFSRYKFHSKWFLIGPGSKWNFKPYASDQVESKLNQFQTWLNLKISDIKFHQSCSKSEWGSNQDLCLFLFQLVWIIIK